MQIYKQNLKITKTSQEILEKKEIGVRVTVYSLVRREKVCNLYIKLLQFAKHKFKIGREFDPRAAQISPISTRRVIGVRKNDGFDNFVA